MRLVRRTPAALLGAGLGAVLATATLAQVPGASRPPEAVAAPESPGVLNFATTDGWRASQLAGLALHDTEGGKVGTVRDVLLDRTGQVRTVLVAAGGLLGVGEREILLPFESIAWMVPDRDAAGAPAIAASVAPATPLRGVVKLPRQQIDAAPTAP